MIHRTALLSHADAVPVPPLNLTLHRVSSTIAMRTLKPYGLRRGDVIGIVSPSGPLADAGRLEKGVRYLESLGYRVKVGRNVGRKVGYLAGTDAQRLHDIHSMFADPVVKALFCLRGGYGTPRLLRFLDYRLISRNPKILLGFSDITGLQLALWRKCRLITFHGPMIAGDLSRHISPATEDHLWRILTARGRLISIPLRSRRARVMRKGTATGRLLGGNLSLLTNLVGTPYLPRFAGTILFVEEVGEEPYKLDRMFTQLRNAGIFRSIRGLLAGTFVDCEPKSRKVHAGSSAEVLGELGRELTVPFLRNLPFGHLQGKITLPVGARATLRATKGSLDLNEPVVL